MSENEIQRRYRLEAERKRAEQAGAPEVSMEELAARALAELSPAISQPPSATPASLGKPSTMGVHGADDDKLIKDDTKAALENAGAMAAVAGRALMEKAREAAAVAQAKANLAQANASAARAKLASAKDAREAQRLEVKARQDAMPAIHDPEPAAVPTTALGSNPELPRLQGPAVEALPEAWVPKNPAKRMPWLRWVGVGLILMVSSGLAWWLSHSPSAEPVPEPTPNVEATSPAPPPSKPRKEVPGPALISPVSEPPPARLEQVVATTEPDFEPVQFPIEVKAAAEVVQPKPAATVEKPKPVVKKPAPQPAAKKIETNDDWQDKGMQELDALEKQLGG